MANSPVKVFRIAGCSASVFRQESEAEGSKRSFHTVAFQRRYQDTAGNWKDSSLTLSDLPAAIRVLQLAQEFIEKIEADTTPSARSG